MATRFKKFQVPLFSTWMPRAAFGAWVPVVASPFLRPRQALPYLLRFQAVGVGLMVLDIWLPQAADALAAALWVDSPLLPYWSRLRRRGMLAGKAILADCTMLLHCCAPASPTLA